MLKGLFLNFLFLFCFSICALAQNTYSVSGTVRDSKESLPGAAIYVSGYKIATVTNNEGKFLLSNLAPGNYDILVQMIGYLPFSQNVTISNKSITTDILLKENATMLKEVVIKPDPNRLYYISLFKDFFIGKTLNAQDCKILNLEVLSFDDDKEKGMLITTANEFIIIENKALGYRIKYLLDYLEYNYKTKMIYYAGYPTFEEMKGNSGKQKKWLKNREIAYNGSMQHFFKSLYNNTVTADGFVVNKISKIKNINRQPDSLINANVKRLTSGAQGTKNLLTFNFGDSLAYWLKQRKEPKELSILNRKDVIVDTLVKVYNDNLKMMSYVDDLYIIYKKEKEASGFDFSGLKQNRTADLSDYQISVVTLLQPSVKFYKNGGISDTRSLLFKGYWAYEKVADMVPMDYLEQQKIN